MPFKPKAQPAATTMPGRTAAPVRLPPFSPAPQPISDNVPPGPVGRAVMKPPAGPARAVKPKMAAQKKRR